MISDANIYILTFLLLATKLADNCCRYGSENQSPDSSLARASLNFGTSHNMMEKERDNLHEILDSQVVLSSLQYHDINRNIQCCKYGLDKICCYPFGKVNNKRCRLLHYENICHVIKFLYMQFCFFAMIHCLHTQRFEEVSAFLLLPTWPHIII